MCQDKVYVADFETTTDIDFQIDGYVRVYLWHARDISSDDEAVGFDIDSFIEWASNIPDVVWFHNLKFDGSYVLNRILEMGWEFSSKQIRGKQTYSQIVTAQGQWMQLVLRFGRHICKLQDSAKKFPGLSLEQIAGVYGIEGKSHLDVFKRREPDYHASEEDIERVKGDTRILKIAMADLYECGYTKLTMASDAMNEFREIYNKGDSTKGNNFDRDFPKLNLDIDQMVRKAYKGGWTYVNKKWKGKDLFMISVYDVNSMYPAQMRYKRLPYGRPYFRDKPMADELYVVEFDCAYVLKKGKLPMVQKKGSFRSTQAEYSEKSIGLEHMCMTCVDYELFKEQYDILTEQNHKYICFRSKTGIFDEYIDKWMAEKERCSKAGDSAGKAKAKRFLNSLYGKFGENPIRESKMPTLDENGVTRWITETSETDGAYVPMACFITAYARDWIVRTAQVFGDDFVYADTDSVHCINAWKGEYDNKIQIDETKLGMWKWESLSYRGRYLRPKAYMHLMECDISKRKKGKLAIEHCEVKCGGMPEACKMNATWSNFKNGAMYEGKLAGKQVKGGYLLSETTYNIRISD